MVGGRYICRYILGQENESVNLVPDLSRKFQKRKGFRCDLEIICPLLRIINLK